MNKRDQQQGLTLMGFIVLLAVLGFFAHMGIKLAPMFIEYYSVKNTLRELSKEAGIAEMSPPNIREHFFHRLEVNSTDHVKPSNVKIERIDSGWKIMVKYEVRRELIANLDVIGRFDASQALTPHTQSE